MAQGRLPFHEEHLEELLQLALRDNRLCSTTDLRTALAASTMAMICINGDWSAGDQADYSDLTDLLDSILEAHRAGIFHGTVVLRSTVPPGTCERVLMPRLEGSVLKLVCNPEFLREGSAVDDFLRPSLIVLGSQDENLSRSVAALYAGLPCKISHVSLQEAEIIKHACNVFHALKICFANEVGYLCAVLGEDGQAVMDVVRSDTRLNASAAYLQPGFAFGGYCLSKETQAINQSAQHLGIDLPLLRSILPSNQQHLQRAVDTVIAQGKHRIGVYGITFKSGTGDMRNSPVVPFVEMLLARGLDVRIHEASVDATTLESSRAFLGEEIFVRFMPDQESWLRSIDCVALTQRPDHRLLQQLHDSGLPLLNLAQAIPVQILQNSPSLPGHAFLEKPPQGPLLVHAVAGTNIELSVVVPTYKEEGNIGLFLNQLCSSLDLVLPRAYSVLVMDDDSPDQTLQQAAEVAELHPQIRLVRRQEKPDLATAVIRGWQMAQGRVLATINADFQHPPSLLAEMWQQMQANDLIVASRYCPGGSVGDWPMSRRILSRGAQWIGELILPQVFSRVSDPLSGCFMLRREAISGVELKPIGYKSLIEVLALGRVHSIAEIPYKMQLRTDGSSKANSARLFDYLKQLNRLRTDWKVSQPCS
jgi:GDP-mannose 6-dehydrogenase